MYDASKGHSISGGDSNLVFGAIFVGVVALAFCIAFLIPIGSKKSDGLPDMKLTSTDNVLLAQLNDPHTREFFTLLEQTDPDAALDLEIDAEMAVENGADKNELVMMVFNALDPSGLQTLAKSDVKHFDAILNHARTGLDSMSDGRSKWCKGSTYEQFADMSQYRIMKEVETTFGYGSDAYEWGIQLNSLVLKARLDGQKNPVRNGTLTAQDQTLLQNSMMQLIADPQVMQLMMIGSMSEQDQRAAIGKVDACQLGSSALGILTSLPTDTRRRMWGEMASYLNEARFNEAISQIGGF
ncbi:MAG: hypothetical protein QNI84_11860 [Henriciella sp.]|nr:hypothetical protein [Henriciella sp.]